MFRTLIVPLDGSELAERALPYAVQLAAASGARLGLIRAVLGPLPSGIDWESQQVAAMEEASAYLGRLAAQYASRVEVITATPYGDPAGRILDQVQALNADAIVMATRGRTGLTHLLQGSVAENVLAHSRVPVLLVYARPGDTLPPQFDPISARILVPLDGSTFAEAAVPVARQILGIAGELVLTTVASPPDHVERDQNGHVRAYLDQQEEALTREAHEYLHEILLQLRTADRDIHAAVDVRVGEPAAGIVMAAADRNCDLVVMSTHGRTGMSRALMGSVAGEVLRSGHVPVLLIGPASPLAALAAEARRPAVAAR
jgi:nucleotide-binding universal stress UspA family protein